MTMQGGIARLVGFRRFVLGAGFARDHLRHIPIPKRRIPALEVASWRLARGRRGSIEQAELCTIWKLRVLP